MPVRPRLRVGVIVDDMRVGAWAYQILRDLSESSFVKLAVVLLTAQGAKVRGSNRPPPDHPGGWLWRAFLRLDQLLLPSRPDALRSVDASLLLRGVPLEVAPGREGDNSDTLARSTIPLESYELDVLLSLSCEDVSEGILGIARYGVWTCSDEHAARATEDSVETTRPWAITTGAGHTLCTLYMLGPGRAALLSQSLLPTDRSSVGRNRSRYYWRAASLVTRKIRELHENGADIVARPVKDARPDHRFSSSLGRHLFQTLSQAVQHFWFRNHWVLLQSRRDCTPQTLADFRVLRPPSGRSWADPFPVRHQGRTFVFLEEVVLHTKKGHIACGEIDDSGLVGEPVTVIDQPYHLAYPFIFQWEGTYYMLPDVPDHRGIDMYKCLEFPYRWTHYRQVIPNVSAADPTLFPFEGRWWLFVTISAYEGASNRDELFVFHGDNPLTDHWVPHARNPVVSDARRARSAGRIDLRDGVPQRPCQDCSREYGYCVRINRIDMLTPDEYQETEIAILEPSPERGIFGVHTLNEAGGRYMADAKLRRCRWL